MKSLPYILWTIEATKQEETRRASFRITQRLLAPTPTEYVLTDDVIKAPLPNGMVKDKDGEYAHPGNIDGPHKATSIPLHGTDHLEYVYTGRIKGDCKPAARDYSNIAKKVEDKTPYKDGYACVDRVTCRALFLHAVNGNDTFNRAYALNYVTRALVSSGGFGEAKKGRSIVDGEVIGKPAYHRLRKTSSSHSVRSAPVNKLSKDKNESIVEDVVQSAALLFFKRQAQGKDATTKSACKFACSLYRQSKLKEKHAVINFLHGAELDGAKQEREEARKARLADVSAALKMDDITARMLAIIESEGNANVQTLATGLGVTRATVYSWLKKLNKEMS